MADNLKDGEAPLLTNAPLCQDRTKRGTACRCPAMKDKRVCRTHGGKSPGAPKGERNGNWRHGGDTNDAVALRRETRALLRALT